MSEPRRPSLPTASIDPATLVESIRARHGITLPLARIAEICRRRGIRALALFGSILRDDFRPDSDIDLLVVYEPESRPRSFVEEFAVRDEFEGLLGRKVDVVEREGVEQSPNYIRRRHILSTAEPIYVEG